MEKKNIEVEVAVTDGGSQYIEVWQVLYKKVSEDTPRTYMIFYHEDAARQFARKLLISPDIDTAFVWQNLVFI